MDDNMVRVCGHCDTGFNVPCKDLEISNNRAGSYLIHAAICPQCGEPNLLLEHIIRLEHIDPGSYETFGQYLAYPSPSIIDTKPPHLEGEEKDVPEGIREIREEAWRALKVIPKSSMLQIRTFLGRILQDKGYGDQKTSLAQMIEKARNDREYPEEERKFNFEVLPAIKLIGNYVAHDPKQSAPLPELEQAFHEVDRLISLYYLEPAKRQRIKEAADKLNQNKEGAA